MLGAIAVVVVVVIVVLSLLVTGVIPGLHTGTSTTSGPQPEQSAAGPANSLATSTGGGPWTLIFVGANDYTWAQHILVQNYSNATCPFHGSTITSITIPAFTGEYYSGLANAWLYQYISAGGATLVVAVQNGSAQEDGQTTGPGCAPGGLEPLPGGLVDSSAAATAAFGSRAGAGFSSSVTRANVSYYLDMQQPQGFHSIVPIWLIQADGCGGHNYSYFFSRVYAANGTVRTASNGSEGASSYCGRLPPPIGSALALGSAVGGTCPSGSGVAPADLNGCKVGDYYYRLTVESSTVELGNFELKVVTATDATFMATGGAAFSVVSITGVVVASYALSSGSLSMSSTWQAFANGISGTTPVTSQDTVVVDMGQTSSTLGESLALQAVGVGSYSGATTTGLP